MKSFSYDTKRSIVQRLPTPVLDLHCGQSFIVLESLLER